MLVNKYLSLQMQLLVESLRNEIREKTDKPLNLIIYDGIRTAIIHGKLSKGERINEKYLSKVLNISRTPIRTALKKLFEDGILSYQSQIGYTVKQVSVKDVLEVYQIRQALETIIFTTAAQNMTKKDFDKLDKLLIKTENKEKNDDSREVMHLFIEFHHFILAHCRLYRVEEVYKQVEEYMDCFRDFSLNSPLRRKQAVIEHRLLYFAMLTKDDTVIESTICDHLNFSKIFICEKIEEENANQKNEEK